MITQTILAILCLLPIALSGQPAAITGRVFSNNQPLEWANAELAPLGLGAATDSTGRFHFKNLPAGAYELRVSMLGYQRLLRSVAVKPGEQLDLGRIDLVEDAFGLDEVVVTGNVKGSYLEDSPIRVEVISSRFLEKIAAPVNLVESVALINGVQETVACGVCYTNSISINGLPGPYTAVLLDGIPMYGNLAAVYGLNGIPRTIIDRIEVIKGPVSTQYGSEAMAGVINVITKDPADQPRLALDLMGTSHRESFGSMNWAGKTGSWNGLIGLDYGYANIFEDENQDYFSDVVNFDRVSLFTKWNQAREQQRRFSLFAKYYYEDRRNGVQDFLRGRAYRELRGSDSAYGESIYTNRIELSGLYDLPLDQPIRLEFSLSAHDQNSYYGADFYQAQQGILFGNLIWEKRKGPHNLMLGLSNRWQYYDDNTIATQSSDGAQNAPSRQYIPGIFAQHEWEPGKRWTLLSGLRLDHYQRHGPILSPRLNLRYKPGDWTTLRLNLGTGFRIVNLFTEDHAFVTGQREVLILEDLRPERSFNSSLNLNHIFTAGESQGTLDLEAFWTYFTNKIIPDYDTPGQIIYGNLPGHAQSLGLSFNLQHQFRFPLAYTLGITVQSVTSTEPDQNGAFQTTILPFAPAWTGVATFNYQWKKPRLGFSYTLNATGRMTLPTVFDLDAQGRPQAQPRPIRSQAFALHQVQISKSFKKPDLEFYAGIQNIFDFRQPWSPLTGYNDPNSNPGFSPFFDTAYAYGPLHGREVYVGVRVKKM